MRNLYLGIDTSNYRTSVALIDAEGHIVAQKAVLLDVPEGKRGLRQSEAFFMHSNRLPGYIEELFGSVDPVTIKAVGVSERPRRVEGSYMPCFLAGANAVRVIASALKVPVYSFSHQEGHAAAVMEYGQCTPCDKALFFHLSGGTTEALICSPDDKGYSMEIVGGSRDISVGQLLDRFGVAMGMPFPSGSYLDDIAYKVLEKTGFDTEKTVRTGVLPSLRSVEGWFNLSGAETRLMRYAKNTSAQHQLFAESEDAQHDDFEEIPSVDNVTAELFTALSGLLISDAHYLKERCGAEIIYMAGGVASSRSFRAITGKSGITGIRFGAPELSGDNAVGIALLAKRLDSKV